MTTDQDLGGRLEVVNNDGNYVISRSNKIVLSLLAYTGNVWPKILRTAIKEFVTVDVYPQEYTI